MRPSFGKPEFSLVISSRAVPEPSGVRITARIPIPSPADLLLGDTVVPMTAARP